MMSHLCNRYVREFLILARTWFAFGLPSKTGCDISGIKAVLTIGPLSKSSTGRFKDLLIITLPHPWFCFKILVTSTNSMLCSYMPPCQKVFYSNMVYTSLNLLDLISLLCLRHLCICRLTITLLVLLGFFPLLSLNCYHLANSSPLVLTCLYPFNTLVSSTCL
jgi:hypothetical protein